MRFLLKGDDGTILLWRVVLTENRGGNAEHKDKKQKLSHTLNF
jgi:hypothetical protein